MRCASDSLYLYLYMYSTRQGVKMRRGMQIARQSKSDATYHVNVPMWEMVPRSLLTLDCVFSTRDFWVSSFRLGPVSFIHRNDRCDIASKYIRGANSGGYFRSGFGKVTMLPRGRFAGTKRNTRTGAHVSNISVSPYFVGKLSWRPGVSRVLSFFLFFFCFLYLSNFLMFIVTYRNLCEFFSKYAHLDITS